MLNNKLGNIIDLTVFIENFKNKKAFFLDLLKKKLGNTYYTIKSYDYNDKNIKEYDDFKKEFLNIWDEKEYLLDNYINKDYHKLEIDYPVSSFLLITIAMLVFFKIAYSTKGISLLLYLLLSIVVVYIHMKKK